MAKNTRTKLIEAGELLFSEHGFKRTSVGDIEAYAGLKARGGGFYRHFTSKESLLVELAVQRFEVSDFLGIREVFPLGDTRAELLYIARSYDKQTRRHRRLINAIRAEAPQIPELTTRLLNANQKVATSLIDWIITKPAAQSFDQAQAAELVLMILGGWLLYLSRNEEFEFIEHMSPERMLNNWSNHWGSYLDSPAITKQAIDKLPIN